MDETLVELGEHIAASLGETVIDWSIAYGELTVRVDAGQIVEVIGFLQSDATCQFVNLSDICGVDWPSRDNRFDVVYHLLSPKNNARIRVKLETDDRRLVPSICEVFPCADWFEREIYDLYGVLFANHPDLRRILTDYGFDGHPLRKDFPLTGFVEVHYDDQLKRVVYEPVRLRQEFRNFDFVSPWEGTEYDLPGDEKSSLS